MDAPSATVPHHALPKFDNTAGAFLLTGVVGTALWGVACAQTYAYYMDSKTKDPVWMKWMMAFIWVVDTFDTVLIVHVLYYYLVSNFANPVELTKPIWSVVGSVAMTAVTDLIIRALFLSRVYRFSKKNIWLTGGITLLSLGDFVTTVVVSVKASKIESFLELKSLHGLVYAIAICGDICDFFLAFSLLYFLYKSRTTFKRTNNIIRTLMLYTVNTGLVVAIDAIFCVITYAIMPNNYIFLAFYLLMGKIYVNAYLATINARSHLRDESEEPQSIHFSDLRGTSTDPASSYGHSAGTKTKYFAGSDKSYPLDTGSEAKAVIDISSTVAKDRDYHGRAV